MTPQLKWLSQPNLNPASDQLKPRRWVWQFALASLLHPLSSLLPPPSSLLPVQCDSLIAYAIKGLYYFWNTMILEGHEFPDRTEYSQLLSKALKISHRFQTEKEPFNHTYIHNDLIQRYHTRVFIPKIVHALKSKQQALGRPIQIADFCSGCGEISAEVMKTLEKEGVEVSRMVGFEISEELLSLSRKHQTDKLTFEKCNVEKYEGDELFDAVIVLHGLQWMNDIDGAVQIAALALRPQGLLFSLTYLECRQFFKARYDFLRNSGWRSCFDPLEFELYPFHFQSSVYLHSFQRYFYHVFDQNCRTEFEYTKTQMIRIFDSILSEVRHLQKGRKKETELEVIAEKYIGQFMGSLGEVEGCVKRKGKHFSYSPEMHYYVGVKKTEKAKHR